MTLHVYDVGQLEKVGPEGVKAINRCLRPFGTGAFHCGVEVFGQEWSFKMEPRGTGVENYRPRRCEAHNYSESLHMGHTPLSKPEVYKLIFSLEKDWLGSSYHSLRRNCCHFCDVLCMQLGVGHIPPWVTRLASAGASLIDAGQMLEDALSTSSLFCTCMRQSPLSSTEIKLANGPFEAPFKGGRATPSLGADSKPPARSPPASQRERRYRSAFVDGVEWLDAASGVAEETHADDATGEEAIFARCGVDWPQERIFRQEPIFASCGGEWNFCTRNGCYARAPATLPPQPRHRR